MYRIDNETNIALLPTPAAVGPNPNGYFTKGDPNGGIPATIVDDDWANAVQEEICNAITAAGITLNKTKQNQLALAISSNLSGHLTGGGSVTAITGTATPAPSSLVNGMRYVIKSVGENTTTNPTFNLNGLGAKTIVKGANKTLAIGDILAAPYRLNLLYDSSSDKWILLNPGTMASTVPSFRAYRNSDQSVSHNTTTKILFNNEDYDTVNGYNTATSKYVVQYPGKYFFHAQVYFSSPLVDGSLLRTTISVNGTVIGLSHSLASGTEACPSQCVAVWSCADGDEIEVSAYHNNGVSKTVFGDTDYSFFNGFRIGD